MIIGAVPVRGQDRQVGPLILFEDLIVVAQSNFGSYVQVPNPWGATAFLRLTVLSKPREWTLYGGSTGKMPSEGLPAI